MRARGLTGRLSPQQVVGAVYVSAMFMTILDSTIVTVALPAMARDFRVTAASTDGVVVGYLVSLAVWIPASGWFGDRFGTRRTFLTALSLFTIASVLCGLSRALLQLVLFRVLQGVGGGMLTPVGMAMLYRTFPPAERARAARVLVVPTVMAPALGPIIGGALVDHLSWRWVFFVNAPIGVMAFLFGLLALREHRERAREHFDVRGFVLAAAGFAALLYALSETASSSWHEPRILATGVGGLALIAALVVTELRSEDPMIDFRLFSNRLFAVSNLASLFGAAGFIGLLFIAPLYLQAARGFSAFTSGSTTAPEALGVLAASQLVGRLYPRVGPRRLMVAGMLWIVLGTAALSRVMDGDLWLFRALMFAIGAGWALVVIPVNAGAFAQISGHDTGRATALYNAQRQLAAALGVAILATVVGSQLAGAQVRGNTTAFAVAVIGSGGFALVGAGCALWIRDSDAESTMRRRTAQAVA